MILRAFGARALRARLAEHIRLAQELASWIDAHPDFERLAPVPFSVVCFRWKPAGMSWSDAEVDAANERLLDLVNASGDIFLSHTRLRGRLAIRVAIGHLRTTDEHVRDRASPDHGRARPPRVGSPAQLSRAHLNSLKALALHVFGSDNG